MRLECLACGGIYDDVLLDGCLYFHACPPLSRDELDVAFTAGRVALPVDETVDDAIARRVYQRSGHRDENVVPAIAEGAPATIRRAGRGTRPAPAAPRGGPVIVPD